MNGMKRSLSRCLLVWLTTTLLILALVHMIAPDLVAAAAAINGPGLDTQPFDTILLWLCATAATVCACWLWAGTTAVVLEAVRGTGRPWQLRGVPAPLRRLVLVACGIAVAGLVSPATATPGPVHLDRTGQAGAAIIEGLPLPDRATGAAHGARGPGTPATGHVGPTADPTVSHLAVVHPGDSLWSIARTDLGSTAQALDITGHWHRIYALNRDLIGPDPDLVRPGQRLRMPLPPA